MSEPWSGLREGILDQARERLRRVQPDVVPAIQAGVAGGLAWFLASNVLDHPGPFFAPISAVIVLGAAAGKRWRRALEMVVGVALGIAVGDLIILAIGVGAVQIAVVVLLATLVSIFLGGSSVFVGQAAASAVLVATFAPPSGGIYINRFLDALIGGGVGLAVMAAIPFNPLTRVQHDAGQALDLVADALKAGAEALEQSNPRRARRSLDALREAEEEYARFRDSLTIGQETAAVSPLRWSSRSRLQKYVDTAVHIERGTRNARVMQHWIVAVIRDKGPVPEMMPESLRTLSRAVVMLRKELLEGVEPVKTREIIRDAVRQAWAAYADGVGFSGGVVVAQVRGIAVDLLIAAGLSPPDAEEAVREAATPRGQDRR